MRSNKRTPILAAVIAAAGAVCLPTVVRADLVPILVANLDVSPEIPDPLIDPVSRVEAFLVGGPNQFATPGITEIVAIGTDFSPASGDWAASDPAVGTYKFAEGPLSILLGFNLDFVGSIASGTMVDLFFWNTYAAGNPSGSILERAYRLIWDGVAPDPSQSNNTIDPFDPMYAREPATGVPDGGLTVALLGLGLLGLVGMRHRFG